MAKNISLLEATLRDGGQGLEDSFKNGFTDKFYTPELKQTIVDNLVKSDIEIIELGTMDPSENDLSKFAIYQNIEELSKNIPQIRNPKQMYVGLYIGPDTDVDKIPDWNPSLVEGVRVILRYSELKKSLDYCAALTKKGYKVFVQPMLTMRYTNDELDLIIKYANEMNAFAIYFVDSYGYMYPKDIQRLFDYYKVRVNKEIKIGFHPHNNMNLAYANTLYFLNIETDRKLIVDSCCTGMGQGAGNLHSELIVPYLNDNFDKAYNYYSVLETCEAVENHFMQDNLWGYSITRLLPAFYKTAYKYSLILRKKYSLTYSQINAILKDMPDEMRNRYTPENVEQLVQSIKA